MELPKPIRVGHYKVRFEVVPENYDHEEDDTKDAWGFYVPKYKVIYLDPELEEHPIMLAEVLIHEVQHAINDVYGVEEDTHSEEKMVTQGSRGWTQVMIDSPELMDFIRMKLH